MDLLNQKIAQIKKEYFCNFLNQKYIDDSYLFIINLPDEIIRKYSKDPIFKIIPELYKKNHNIEKEILNYNNNNSLSDNRKKNQEDEMKKNNQYLKLITSFLKEKEQKEKEEKELQKKMNETLTKYYKEELFIFLSTINKDTLLKQKILNSKSPSFQNLLNFEEKVINFLL